MAIIPTHKGGPKVESVISPGAMVFPQISRVKLLRSWGGIMDMTMDGSPIIGTCLSIISI